MTKKRRKRISIFSLKKSTFFSTSYRKKKNTQQSDEALSNTVFMECCTQHCVFASLNLPLARFKHKERNAKNTRSDGHSEISGCLRFKFQISQLQLNKC
jgi:hypothetical protein